MSVDIRLTKQELEDIINFLEDTGQDTVLITKDSSSGIGYTLKLTINHGINGHVGEFSKYLIDEGNW